MSRRGTKRKAVIDPVSDESDGLFVNDTGRKVNKATKGNKKRLARLEEYDADEGRAGSRGFQKWTELFENNTKGEANKSKVFMKSFQSKVTKNVGELRDYMQQQEDSLEENQDKYAAIFHNLFSSAADPSLTADELKAGTVTSKKEGHTLYKESQGMFSEGVSLLKQFRETDEAVKKRKVDFPMARWKQDKQDIKELLDLGRKHGEQLAEGLLVPNMHPVPKPDQGQLNDKEKLASELFQDSRKALEGDTWGTVAADQVKRFRTLVKAIPPKGQGHLRH